MALLRTALFSGALFRGRALHGPARNRLFSGRLFSGRLFVPALFSPPRDSVPGITPPEPEQPQVPLYYPSDGAWPRPAYIGPPMPRVPGSAFLARRLEEDDTILAVIVAAVTNGLIT